MFKVETNPIFEKNFFFEGILFHVKTLDTQLTWIDPNWFPSKYCSTLEIIFVHYNQDFENFFQELCFFITMYALQDFFHRPIRFEQSPEPLILIENRWEPLNSTVQDATIYSTSYLVIYSFLYICIKSILLPLKCWSLSKFCPCSIAESKPFFQSPKTKFLYCREKGLLLYEPINIEYFIIQCLKPVFRY